jgi:hypothetical protein
MGGNQVEIRARLHAVLNPENPMRSMTRRPRHAVFAAVLVATLAVSADAQQLRIAAKPTVTIGNGTDDRSTLHVIVAAWRLSNGDIAIVEAGSQTPIRAFKQDGKFDRVIARNGAGPGEIGPMLYSATRAGDSIITFDLSGARATVFDAARGTHTATAVVLRNAPARVVVQGLAGASRWLVTGVSAALRTHADGAFRDTTFLGVATVGGDSVVVIGRVPGMALYANNRVPGPPNMMRVRYDSLVPWTTFLTLGDRIIVADPAADEIMVFDATGKHLPSIRVPFAAAAYDPREVGRALARSLALAKTATDSGFRAAMFNLASRPKNAPRFKRVIAGADGELWIEKFWLDESAPREYAVVDRAGRLIGHVTGAPAVRFTDFGRDYAVGIAVDDDGVQTVVLHKITR